MDEIPSIDASDLLYVPLTTLREIILELEENGAGTDFCLTVIRWAAFGLISGMVVPDGCDARAAVRRGFDMLGVLRDHAQKHP
ncbi:MAG: hypothetical protein FD135_4206 [Comamonadaceae bacterium]|nr:MAG: hypothetical protein FD135_4206 [Comamonadaceae bacterium]